MQRLTLVFTKIKCMYTHFAVQMNHNELALHWFLALLTVTSLRSFAHIFDVCMRFVICKWCITSCEYVYCMCTLLFWEEMKRIQHLQLALLHHDYRFILFSYIILLDKFVCYPECAQYRLVGIFMCIYIYIYANNCF